MSIAPWWCGIIMRAKSRSGSPVEGASLARAIRAAASSIISRNPSGAAGAASAPQRTAQDRARRGPRVFQSIMGAPSTANGTSGGSVVAGLWLRLESFARDRQVDLEDGSRSRLAPDGDRPPVAGDDRLRDEQAQARSLSGRLGGEERLEQVPHGLGAHPGAGVAHGQPHAAVGL